MEISSNKQTNINSLFKSLEEKYNDIPIGLINDIKTKYLNDSRSFELIEKEINIFTQKLDFARQITARQIDQNILDNSILLIGPMGVGKTTISKDLSGLLNMPRISLDNKEQLQYYYKDRDKFLNFKEFEFYLTSSVLTSLKEPAIIDFGAGHSVYENPIMFYEMSKIINKFNNVELILPTENKDETLRIINERIKKRKGNVSEHTFKTNEHFVNSTSYLKLAKDVIYTKGKTINEVEDVIIDNVSSKTNNNTYTNEINKPQIRTLYKSNNNGFASVFILTLITGFMMGITFTLAYIFISK